jgi:hypothetical protein
VRAGPFTDLRVRGELRRGPLRATAAYRFTPGAIRARWTVHGRRAEDRANVTFPSWGRATRVTAILRGGRRVPVGARPRDLGGVAALDLGGYRVRPLRAARGAAVRVTRGTPASSVPDPGPTLEVDLPAGSRALAVALTVGAG